MDTGDILVSVVIPVRNCARHICQAIDSALTQEVPVEVLVVDDASTDHPETVLQRYAEDSRVRVIKNETRMGVATSRNTGVSAAQGNYIAFLDADDYWMPDKLNLQLSRLAKTGAVLCTTARELMLADGTLTGHIIPVREKITYRAQLMQNQINCPSVLIRTDVAREFPMHHDDSHEDYIMWFEVLQKYQYACGVNLPLLKYRISLKSKSGNKLKSAKMTWKVYQYMGFGVLKSALCFLSYGIHGLVKWGFFLFLRVRPKHKNS